jgi:hypothetical protein
VAEDNAASKEQEVLDDLRTALAGAVSARLDYEAKPCWIEGTKGAAFFPEVSAHPPNSATVAAAVKEIFQNDSKVRVEGSGPIIRIRIGRPSTRILKIRIQELRFGPLQRFNGDLAVVAVLDSREVRSVIQREAIRMPVYISAGASARPDPSLPHLPKVVRGVTVDQVLDLIVATFKGIVVYGACSTPESLNLDFASDRF